MKSFKKELMITIISISNFLFLYPAKMEQLKYSCVCEAAVSAIH